MDEHKTETAETIPTPKRTRTKRQEIIVLALTSFLGAILIVDIFTMGFMGIFGLLGLPLGLIIVIAVLVYPIVRGKRILLLIPFGIIALTFTVFFTMQPGGFPFFLLFITFPVFTFVTYPVLIPFFLIIMGIVYGLRVAVVKLIRWFRSANKKKQISFLRITVIFVLMVAGLFLSSMIVNPLRRPDASLRAYLFRVMPISTSISDAVYIVENHRQWEPSRRGLVFDRGIPINLRGTPTHPHTHVVDRWSPERVIGEQSMVIRLGTYRTLFFGVPSSVEAFIAFDGDGELIEIFIHRLMHFPF